MLSISMSTIIALNYLTAHRERHIDEFQKQLEGWKNEMEKYTDALSQWANQHEQGGESIKRPEEPQKPVDYLKTYDSMIYMIKKHEEEFISLDEDEFDKIVLDEFYWKGTFHTNSIKYSVHG